MRGAQARSSVGVIYDLKTMSYSKTSWGNPDVVHNVTKELLTTPGRVLETRARHEHADYLRRARAIDGLTGVAAGAVGPVEARLLRDFGPLRPAHHARRGGTLHVRRGLRALETQAVPGPCGLAGGAEIVVV